MQRKTAARGQGDGSAKRGRLEEEDIPTAKRAESQAPLPSDDLPSIRRRVARLFGPDRRDGQPAYRMPSGVSFVTWCDGCLDWHWHGAGGGEGHRVAHCPQPGGGYVLVDFGAAPAWVIEDAHRTKPRGPHGDAGERRRRRPRIKPGMPRRRGGVYGV